MSVLHPKHFGRIASNAPKTFRQGGQNFSPIFTWLVAPVAQSCCCHILPLLKFHSTIRSTSNTLEYACTFQLASIELSTHFCNTHPNALLSVRSDFPLETLPKNLCSCVHLKWVSFFAIAFGCVGLAFSLSCHYKTCVREL